jgi:hypothetical protein
MEAPSDWTYGGHLDWSSADTLRLAPMGMAIRCIVEALKERAEAANYALPEILTTDWNPLRTPYEVVSAIQESVTTLLTTVSRYTKRANFYKNDVDILTYAYNETPATWTEASALTAIGASARIVPARLGLLREWVYQQYQLLNLMRQCVADNFMLYERGYVFSTSEWKYYYGEGYSQSEAEADYQYRGTYENNLPRGKGGYVNPDGRIFIFCQSCIDSLRFWNSGTMLANLGVEIDWYYCARKYNDFYNFGDGFTEDIFVKKYTTSHAAEELLTQSNRLPPGEASAPVLRSYSIGTYEGYNIERNRALLKFDGENGFKFRDW